MCRRTQLSIRWISLLTLIGLVASAAPAGATSIRRVPGLSHRAHLASARVPGVYTHSFLGVGPLSGAVVQGHVPNGRAIGWHRHHDGGMLSSPVSDPPRTTADTTPDDTTEDNTSPAIPEASAALLFGAGSLLVSTVLRRRKAAS